MNPAFRRKGRGWDRVHAYGLGRYRFPRSDLLGIDIVLEVTHELAHPILV